LTPTVSAAFNFLLTGRRERTYVIQDASRLLENLEKDAIESFPDSAGAWSASLPPLRPKGGCAGYLPYYFLQDKETRYVTEVYWIKVTALYV
jgi:hypothetical protein